MNVAITTALLSQVAAVGLSSSAPVELRADALTRTGLLVAAADAAPVSSSGVEKSAPIESVGGSSCSSTLMSMFSLFDTSSSKVIEVRDCWWILEQVRNDDGTWNKPQN